MRHLLTALSAAIILLLAGPLSHPAGATTTIQDNTQTGGCTTNSTQTFDSQNNQTIILIDSVPCAVSITMADTRYQRVGTTETQVTVPYMVHEPPSGTPTKALVVLLTGGDGCAAIAPPYASPNPCASSADATAYRNFLIRSAQLFANHGFKALTIDRPFNINPPTANYNDYRLSQMHAVDIAGVVGQENPDNKAVFLIGTSRGTLSAFAQSVMGTASMLSSPVTANPAPPTSLAASPEAYLGDGIEPEFQPAWLETPMVTMPLPVPVQILEHQQDGCSESPPSGAKALYKHLIQLNPPVEAYFHEVTGGFNDNDISTDPTIACEAVSNHGFLGIERKVVGRISRRMTSILSEINTAYPNNHRPVSGSGSLATSSSTPISLDLTTIASDPDGDPLTFALPHLTSARGAALSLGSDGTVSYDASGAGFAGTVNDSFVYVASDQNGQGKKSFGIITVTVTAP